MKSSFDVKLLHDFTEDNIEMRDMVQKYKLSNVWDSEDDHSAIDKLNETFYRDYACKLANPKSYLKEGMDARLAVELRKSSVLYIDDYFFEAHLEGWTWEEIKLYRSEFLRPHFIDYEDHDWQYYWAAKFSMTHEQFAFFEIVFEDCFADGDPDKPDDLGDPPMDFAARMYFKPGTRFFS